MITFTKREKGSFSFPLMYMTQQKTSFHKVDITFAWCTCQNLYENVTDKNLGVSLLHFFSETNVTYLPTFELCPQTTWEQTACCLETLCDSVLLTSCRLLHLSFTSETTNKRLPKSPTHMKISGRCWFPYSIRGQIKKREKKEKEKGLGGTVMKNDIRRGREGGAGQQHVSPRASDDKWKTSSKQWPAREQKRVLINQMFWSNEPESWAGTWWVFSPSP